MESVADIKEQLLRKQFKANCVPSVDGTGVYAFVLTGGELPGLPSLISDVLYVGMNESSLSVRNHFQHSNSGFSSPRRTLGALLKEQLKLIPIPRSSGASLSNTNNYKFAEEGEQALRKWMEDHLTYGYALVDHDIRSVEKALIAELRPPLNLTGWPNPHGSKLRYLRTICKQEAEAMSGV